MLILSPKTNFMGGALISAVHLAKVTHHDEILTWKNDSEFLKRHGLTTRVLNIDSDLKLGDPNSIWVNDTCFDKGYYIQYKKDNHLMWDWISSHFKCVHILNHQPINRQLDYLLEIFDKLKFAKVYFHNYRQCWTDECNFYLKPLFPSIHFDTCPYFYDYRDFVGKDVEKIFPDDIICIGRDKSKCKASYQITHFRDITGRNIDRIFPDKKVVNENFVKTIGAYGISLTGYYYGGEGNPEIDVPYNKLEWSYLDSILVKTLPITSTLFKSELQRLGIKSPLSDYIYDGKTTYYRDHLYNQIKEALPHVSEYRDIILEELRKGNKIINKMFRNW